MLLEQTNRRKPDHITFFFLRKLCIETQKTAKKKAETCLTLPAACNAASVKLNAVHSNEIESQALIKFPRLR